MADFQKNIQFTIIQYLVSQVDKVNSSQKESLQSAISSLESVFGLSRNDQHLSLGKPLESLLQQYAPAPSDIDVEKEPGFEQKLTSYLNVLKSKKYFEGAVEGSPEYQQRYQKAKEKLIHRLKEEAAQKSEKKKFEEAEAFKLEGNKYLQDKKMHEAIDCYTKAIALNPTSAIYYCNRAAAYTHLKEYEKAAADCEVSITRDPKYSKAYSRLGLARLSLGQNSQSVEAYRKALELDPGNSALQDSLKAAEQKVGGSRQGAGGMPGMGAGGMPGMGAGGMPGMGPGGMPGMGAGGMPGMGPGGMPGMGPGGFADLLNNPNIMQMAQQLASQPGFADLLNNPNLASMAQNLMQNPDALNMVNNMMRGGADGPGDGPSYQQE